MNISEWIAQLLAICIAALFFLPFYMKLKSFEGLQAEIHTYDVLTPRLLPWAASTVLLAEFGLSVLFAAGWGWGWRHILGTGLLGMFALFTWRKKRRSGVESCACFGTVSFLNRFPIYRNMVIIGLLLADAVMHREPVSGGPLLQSFVLAMALSFTIELLQQFRKQKEA